MKGLSVLAAVVVLLMVHAWRGFSTRVSPLASCEPSCEGVDSYVEVPDPENCTNFYYCQDGIPYGPLQCGPGNYFDADALGCLPLDPAAPCEPQCSGDANCPLTCQETYDIYMIGDAFDCNIYYFCTVTGASEPFNCSYPEKPYYDGNTQMCSADESVCCRGYCTPYCTGGGYLAPDPNSCTEFYLCEEEGVPSEDLKFPCDPGYVFNVQRGSCVIDTGEPCQTLCEAVSGGTTTPGSGGSTDINGCVSSLDCTAAGDFAACSTCQQEYFHCSGAGASGVRDSCPFGYVFNPVSELQVCLYETDCPRYP